MDSGTYEVTLRFERLDGGRLSGSYRVDAVRGSFSGTVDEGALDATLEPSDDCSYSLTGTLAHEQLDATFEPTGCPGGGSGRWELQRDG